MEIVGSPDRPTLLVFNSKREIPDHITRPALAPVACPDVGVAGVVELDPARDEALEQRLINVDRVGVDSVLVAGVDLRKGADIPRRTKTTGTLGRRVPLVEWPDEKKPFWAIGTRPRAISVSPRHGWVPR